MAIEDCHSASIEVPTKNPFTSFCTLSNISKDAEFQELSETGFMFLGHHDSTKLVANYYLEDDDQPLPFWRHDRLLKLILMTTDIDHFVENSFLHLLIPPPT